ncbi:spermidine synthase [Angustibacter luteus]|uniref:Spermidine synthase n=1 Tax=Angustibacter luteus TaxID=658456 RepID=A0ABW1JBB8_9ACTN
MSEADQPPSRPSVVQDPDDPLGYTMLVSGVPSSYVHLGDPTRLEFEYVRWAGDVIDVMAAEGEPVHTVHVGGAGCTLARYVAATRPRSRQIVLDDDPAVIELARQTFGYSRRSGFRLREGDGLEGLRPLESGHFDLVIRDAFAGDTTPAHLTTTEFVGQAARVLSADGLYVANIADRPGLGLVRREVATALTLFSQVALVGETQHLRGRRYGNVLLLASRRRLPIADLTRRVVSGPVPARVVPPSDVRQLASGADPITPP